MTNNFTSGYESFFFILVDVGMDLPWINRLAIQSRDFVWTHPCCLVVFGGW